jgi:hypothetical protein
MPTRIEELRLRLRGGLHEPGEREYADACTLFNSMIERRPRLVARCAAVDDVIAALAFARDHGIEVTVRAGGHSVTGRSLCDGGLVLDVRGLAEIEVDPLRRVVRVGGGATWAAVDRASPGAVRRIPALARRPTGLSQLLDRRASRRPLGRRDRADRPTRARHPARAVAGGHRPLGR